jgi:steroid delta-isomerase-like uncharacterized protein
MQTTHEHDEIELRNLSSVSDVLAYWNTQDVSGILEFYDDAITWRNVAMERTYQGKDAVGAFLAELMAAFPDLQFDVVSRLARGDFVAEEWSLRGTHRGPFMGIPPTGRRVEIPGMSLVKLSDGRFVGDQFYFDSGLVLRQLGLLPPLAVLESRLGRGILWLLVNRMALLRGLAIGAAATLIGRLTWRIHRGHVS